MTTETGGLDLDPDACSKHPDECCNCPPEGEYADEVESLASLCGRAGTPCASGLARIIQKQQTRVDALLAEVERLRQGAQAMRAAIIKLQATDYDEAVLQRNAALDCCAAWMERTPAERATADADPDPLARSYHRGLVDGSATAIARISEALGAPGDH